MSRTSKSRASKTKINSVDSGVGKMATLDSFIYTYTYTDHPDTVYCFWELHCESQMKEIQQVLSYYHQKSIIESYLCGKTDISEAEWSDFMYLMDGNKNMVRRNEYDCMLPVLQTKIITQYNDVIPDENVDVTLHRVTIFGKTWYIPLKNAISDTRYIKSIPITVTNDPGVLLNWWNQAIHSKKISYDTISKRIELVTGQCLKEDLKEDIRIEMRKAIVVSYMNMYMKPSCNKESILLSEVYQDFLTHMTDCRYTGSISQATFIKELREQTEHLKTKINIVRHARGMVITNYTISNNKAPSSNTNTLDSMYEIDDSIRAISEKYHSHAPSEEPSTSTFQKLDENTLVNSIHYDVEPANIDISGNSYYADAL
jgi:hypothetical protein